MLFITETNGFVIATLPSNVERRFVQSALCPYGYR